MRTRRLLPLLVAILVALPAGAQDLVENPSFDDALQLDGWEIPVEVQEAFEAVWDIMDFSDRLDSGSAFVTSTENLRSGLVQCVPVDENTLYLLGARIFIPSDVSEGQASVRGVWRPQPDCTGPSLVVCPADDGGVRACRLVGSLVGVRDAWELSLAVETSPPTTQSVQIVLQAHNQAQLPASFGAFFDEVALVPEPATLLLQVAALALLVGLARARRMDHST